MTFEAKLKQLYQEFVNDFDPTPEYLYDPPYHLPDYDQWRADWEDEKFVEISNVLLLQGETPEKEIEPMAHRILDNPEQYPEWFND